MTILFEICAQPGASALAMRGLLKHHVLCVDRDKVSLSIRTALLNAGGFDVTGHSTVRDAERLAQKQAFDAVIVDENVLANGSDDLTRISQVFSSLPMLVLQSRSPFAPNRLHNGRVWTFAKGDGPEVFLAAVRECIASAVGSRAGGSSGSNTTERR